MHPAVSQLQQYLESTLDSPEMQQIEGHVSDCKECQETLEKLIREMLGSKESLLQDLSSPNDKQGTSEKQESPGVKSRDGQSPGIASGASKNGKGT